MVSPQNLTPSTEPSARVLGIHHVTAICGDPQRNLDFYAGFLGLRFVKRTVNFDDPQTYHFYYGDEAGTPGSILTFFPWPGARAGRVGAGQVAVVAFATVPSAIGFWVQRLVQHGIAFDGPTQRETSGDEREQVLAFRDHDGLMLEIVARPGAAARPAWGGAPGVPLEHALRGFHHVMLWVARADATERMLAETLGFRPVDEPVGVRRPAAGDGGPGTLVEVREVGDFPRGVGGVGTIHHVAWRVADDEAQRVLRSRVAAAGLEPTPVIDRQYFRSVYFREPGGVLFELATDPPGFTVDEPLSQLGERLMLPPQYEPYRPQLEAVLPPIHLPVPASAAGLVSANDGPEDVSGDALGFIHRYEPPVAGAELASGVSLLLLHGTGGDEEDLVSLGRALLPGAGLLSPRGKVLERGMPRFFRRLAEGVFDQDDLERRTHELGDFIEAAIRVYGLCRDGIVAVGFSNGANIAASLLLRRPGLLRGAVLLSPMVPFEPDRLPDLAGTAVFLGAGRADPIAPPAQVERLGELLRQSGAAVSIHWEAGGHTVAQGEVDAARQWLLQWIAERPEPLGTADAP
jgi:predicted esterase/catechol 2,3-dioxygenase-like lactoylglutathione lyase family enzyme